MRLSGRWLILLVLTGVAGLLLLIAANHFHQPQLIGPGLLLFAVGTFAAGAEAISRRYMADRSNVTTRTPIFVGPGAVLLGLVLVIMSLGLAVAGVAFLTGAQQTLLAFLLDRPGFALLPAGIAVGAGGIARVIGARDWNRSPGRFLASLPERFSGALLLLFGLAMLAAGLFEFVAPAAFDRIVNSLLAPFKQATR